MSTSNEQKERGDMTLDYVRKKTKLRYIQTENRDFLVLSKKGFQEENKAQAGIQIHMYLNKRPGNAISNI